MKARCQGCGRYARWLIEVGDGDDTGLIGPCCASARDVAFYDSKAREGR